MFLFYSYKLVLNGAWHCCTIGLVKAWKMKIECSDQTINEGLKGQTDRDYYSLNSWQSQQFRVNEEYSEYLIPSGSSLIDMMNPNPRNTCAAQGVVICIYAIFLFTFNLRGLFQTYTSTRLVTWQVIKLILSAHDLQPTGFRAQIRGNQAWNFKFVKPEWKVMLTTG